MNDFMFVIVCVLGCIGTFFVGYAAGLAYAVDVLKAKAEGEKDE